MTISRIAPTPSGLLHIGNLYNFIETYIRVKKQDGQLHLRIDDIDSQRSRDEYIQDIFDTLEWIGIKYDQGPKDVADFKENYSQLHKIDFYRTYLNKLKNVSYVCKCSRKTIPQCNCRYKNIEYVKGETSIRIDTSLDPWLHTHMPNFVIWRKDDLPAYQLTSIVDDIYAKIDLIIRGEDLINSTKAQEFLAKEMGEDISKIRINHHQLVLEENGTKLSKSFNATSLKSIIASGTKQKTLINNFCVFMNYPVYNSLEELIGANI